MKRHLSKLLIFTIILMTAPPAFAKESEKKPSELADDAKSAVLIERDTGKVMYDKNSREKLPPASMTKVMTMLLIMEALDEGKIKMKDKVRTSEYAASMGDRKFSLSPAKK